jgi:tape measure domain-containing protein
MANQVKPSDIIDIDGLIKDIGTLEGATQKYDATASKMLDALSKRVTAYRKEIQDLVKALSGQGVDGDFTKQAKGLAEYRNALQGLAAAQERLNKSVELSTLSVEELKQRQKDLIKVNSALKSEVTQDTEAIKNNEKALKETSQTVNQLTATMKNATKQVKFAKGSYDELQQSLSNDIKALKSLDSAFTVNNGKVTTNKDKIKELTASIKAKQDALKQVDSQMGINTRNVGNYSSAIGFLHGGIRGAVGSMGTWGLAIVAVTEALMGLNQLILVGENLRLSQQGVKNVSDTAVEAEINLEFLRMTADKLGLEIESLNKGFKLFAGATEGTALEGAKTREMFVGITDAIAAMQLTADDATSVMKAFSQSISKGTLQSEELKGQLAEHLPMAIATTAKALGLTTEKLFEQMKAGKLLASDVLPKVAKEFTKTYGKEAKNNAEELTGATNKLNNAWKEFLNSETSGIRSFLTFMYTMIANTLNLISKSGFSGIGQSIKTEENQRRLEVSTSFNASSPTKRKEIMASEIKVFEQRQKEFRDVEAKYREGDDKTQLNYRAKRLKDQATFIKSLSSIIQKEGIQDLAKKEKDLQADAEAREKAEKEAEKARNKKLIADRKAYQIELRENQAKEKEQQAILQISLIQRGITEDEYNDKLLSLSNEFTKQRIDLSKKYIKTNKELEEEMQDDIARNNEDLANNQRTFLINKAKQLQEYYKQIKEDFFNSFDGVKSKIEADINAAEAVNASSADTQKVGVERDRFKQGLTRKGITPSQSTGFDIRLLEIEIANIQKNMEAVSIIYKKANEERVKDREEALAKLAQAEGTDLEKLKTKLEIETKDNKNANDLKYKQDSELANLQMKLSDKVTEKKISDEERLALKKKEEREKDKENLIKGLELAQQIGESINTVSRAYSDNKISDLERQKEYEINLAGDNADAKIAIEERYNKKIKEERAKQDKRDKLSAIFQATIQVALKAAIGDIFGAIAAGVALATIIATPLPKYAKGKKKGDSYTGSAIVGEAGAEIVEKNGKMKLFDKASVTHVDPSTVVYTASETARILEGIRDKKISNELDYNNRYTRTSSRASLFSEAISKSFAKNDLSLLGKTLEKGIGKGFDKATIVINNTDGSTRRRRGESNINDNTRRTIYL